MSKNKHKCTEYNRKYYRKTAIYNKRLWTDSEVDLLFNNELTDRELSSKIKRSMKAIVNKRSNVKKQMQKHRMDLCDFLESFDFSYTVNADNSISLIDNTDTNLGNIESESFDSTIDIVNRLKGYIYDYEKEGINYILKQHNAPIDLENASLKEKIEAARIYLINVYDIYYCFLFPDLIYVKEWDNKSSNCNSYAA